jgi:hypothetical protein
MVWSVALWSWSRRAAFASATHGPTAATLAARVLGEIGDDPHRYADAKARKSYAGTAPITRASGTKRVVLARYARNRRLGDACSNGRSARCAAHPVPAPITSSSAPETSGTRPPYANSPTGTSASSTAASRPGPSTTNTPPGHASSIPPLDIATTWDVCRGE